MKYLLYLKKNYFAIFLFDLILFLLVIALYPSRLQYVYNYIFISNESLSEVLFFGGLGVVVLCPFAIAISIYSMMLYFQVLLDLKYNKIKEEIVKPKEKGKSHFLSSFTQFKKIDEFYGWKVQTENQKNRKLIYFKNDFPSIGKSTKHTYKVTYFKYSKIVVNVEKLNNKTIDSSLTE